MERALYSIEDIPSRDRITVAWRLVARSREFGVATDAPDSARAAQLTARNAASASAHRALLVVKVRRRARMPAQSPSNAVPLTLWQSDPPQFALAATSPSWAPASKSSAWHAAQNGYGNWNAMTALFCRWQRKHCPNIPNQWSPGYPGPCM
jgi:hypothetical protein